MDVELSFYDILAMLNGEKIHLITAANKDKLQHLIHLSRTCDMVVKCLIHYQTKHSSTPNGKIVQGHWCAIMICPDPINTIYFFDSYGEFIDNQLSHIPTPYRKMTKQAKRDIGIILYNAMLHDGFKIVWNEHKLQRKGKHIATCGRYCALFLKSNLPSDTFGQLVKKYSKDAGLTPDEWITSIQTQ